MGCRDLKTAPAMGGFWGVEAEAVGGAWTLGKAKRPEPRKNRQPALFASAHWLEVPWAERSSCSESMHAHLETLRNDAAGAQ